MLGKLIVEQAYSPQLAKAMDAPLSEVAVPKASQRARGLARYVRSDFTIAPGVNLIQLSQNESALRPGDTWGRVVMETLDVANAYPDPECRELRRAIAETFRLDEQRIYCGAGLMECLQTLALAYLDPDDEVVIPEHAFVFFRQVARLAGARITLAPERGMEVDTGSILRAVGPSTKMVIFANPGNPTGTYLPRSEIIKLRESLPSAVLLVIDEAYGEFVSQSRYEPLFDLVDSGNVIVLRSFSKMYGLAGYRIGWAYAPTDVLDFMRRVQIPSIVGAPAQAIATAAIKDQISVQSFKAQMVAVRRRFIDQLAGLHVVKAVESEANFVLLVTGSEEEAKNLDSYLRARGIVLRRQMAVGLGNCLRATIGNEEQMQFVASQIIEWSTKIGRGDGHTSN